MYMKKQPATTIPQTENGSTAVLAPKRENTRTATIPPPKKKSTLNPLNLFSSGAPTSGGGTGGGWSAPPLPDPALIEQASTEMRNQGITLEQSAKYLPGVSELIYRAIDPADDYYSPDQTERILKGIPERLKTGHNKGRRADWGEFSSNAIDDLWSLYLGVPQKHGSIGISNYAPTKVSKGDTPYYYKINNFLRNLTDEEADESQASTVKWIVENIERYPEDRRLVMQHAALGDFTFTHGIDERGPYISYYDKWDLAPVTKNKILQIDKFIGGPLEIYDRIYYDPETFEPLNQ